MILIFSSCATYYFISLISHLLIINHCEPIEILRSKYSYAIQGNRSNILRSVATTTLTIFLIQILPLLLKIIEDLASDFNVSVIFSESYINSGFLDNFDRFSALMAQISSLLQQVAPLIAIFIGAFNLLNSLGKGVAAIKHD